MTPQNECFWNNSNPVHLIWTKFGMDILLDPRDKPAEEFFIVLKIQDGRRQSKICDASSMNCFAAAGEGKITFWLGIWIPFIRFGQKFARTWSLT